MGYLGWTSDLAGYLGIYSGTLTAIGLVALRYWIKRRGSWWIRPALILLPVGSGTLAVQLLYRSVFGDQGSPPTTAGVLVDQTGVILAPYAQKIPEPAVTVLSWAGALVGSWPLATLVSLILPAALFIGRRAVRSVL